MGCFVNKESICPKNSTKFPGVYSSTEPCKDPRAPKPRIHGALVEVVDGIVTTLSKFWCKEAYIQLLFFVPYLLFSLVSLFKICIICKRNFE